VPPACASVRRRVEALVDGEVDARQAADLRAHIAACGMCRAHHAEASSLPARLAAIRTPEPPSGLLEGVLRRVRAERVEPARVWAPLAVELALFVVVLWYVSGLDGLVAFVGRTMNDVEAIVGWGAGVTDLPPAPGGDLFLLLLSALLVVTTLYHLALLSRQGPRLS
jgi:predicted anti-sigma-YlaC factor YlaD